MALNGITAAALQPYLPARILAFGHPDNLGEANAGGSLVCVDLFRHRGPEVIADLGQPLPWETIGRDFDLVLDCGTTEHCHSPTQAFLNAAAACRVGGRVFHHLPVSMLNHGYWNICPSWLRDFYERANGFVIERCDLTGGPGEFTRHQLLSWSHPYECQAVPPESLVLFIARKTRSGPIQLPRCETKWET